MRNSFPMTKCKKIYRRAQIRIKFYLTRNNNKYAYFDIRRFSKYHRC